jgi:hypothetical protein
MNEIRFEALPYDDEEIIRLAISASSGGFSGVAELLEKPEAVEKFATELMSFPASVEHTVTFEHGDDSGDFPYHLVMRAQVIDRAGHSAIFVRIESFCSPIEAAFSEFLVPAEPAVINKLGRSIVSWLSSRNEPLSWQPRA